jgi:exosortase J
MSAIPGREISVPAVHSRELSPVQYCGVVVVLAVLGLSTIWPSLMSLWSLWTTDALKSIGMVIPVVSLALVLRAWRKIGWKTEGSWWGLALLVITTVMSRFQQQGILILVVSPRWSTVLPPPSLMLLAYGSGVVLLVGGVRLYRAALFPILLLWFANPIPSRFGLLVDLPLQHASAHIARAFAISLGHTLTPDHLRLMFTPDFGMFIAPGCNGIRGSLTMGFIALIAGYVYRFRWYANALVVTGAVLLGYAFNLARLCLLVLYYIVALHFPSLQDKAENADYVIGAVLFLIATMLLFAVVHHLRDADARKAGNAADVSEGGGVEAGTPRLRYAQLAALGMIVLLGCAGLAQANAAVHPSVGAAVRSPGEIFPEHLGNYSLVRTWSESPFAGTVVYVWGQYAPAGGGKPVAIGVSPVPDWHDPVLCHSVRGEDPLWQGQLAVATASDDPVSFTSALYADGVTQHIEASTICSGKTCGEFTTERKHLGFIYSRPDARSLVDQTGEKPIRVLVRIETTDMSLPTDVARRQLIEELRLFLGSVKLDDLTRPYSM